MCVCASIESGRRDQHTKTFCSATTLFTQYGSVSSNEGVMHMLTVYILYHCAG